MTGLLLALNMMMCDIKGEIKNPGVYEINENTNINDVIKMAGGLTKNSNVSLINLSKNVKDEMVIYIPNKNEKPKKCPPCICPKVKCETTTIPTTLTTKPTELVTTTRLITSSPIKILININTASIEKLMTINGIGEVIARRIIEYREDTPFEKIDDILNVKGIGDKLFAQIKDFITV